MDLFKICKHRKLIIRLLPQHGVNWANYIARDILQNFRDANKEDINSIKVNVKKDDVTVHGEALFNLRRLLYGSEKGEEYWTV